MTITFIFSFHQGVPVRPCYLLGAISGQMSPTFVRPLWGSSYQMSSSHTIPDSHNICDPTLVNKLNVTDRLHMKSSIGPDVKPNLL